MVVLRWDYQLATKFRNYYTKKSSNEITFEDDFKVGDSETISQNIAIDHLKDSTSINQMVDGGESPITLSLLKSRRYDTYW